MLETDFLHQPTEPLDEVPRKALDYGKRHVVILKLVLYVHIPLLFTSLLHKSKERLELNVMSLPDIQDLIESFDCITSQKLYVRALFKVFNTVSILV